MNKLLILLLMGCVQYHPIEYNLRSNSSDSSNYDLSMDGKDDLIDTVRANAFALAEKTCKYNNKVWKLTSLSETDSKDGAHVHLTFICQGND